MAERLYISEFDDVILPEDYHFSHNIAVRLYDDLVWLLKNEKLQKKIAVTVKFEKGQEFPKDNSCHILDWLIRNNKQGIVDEIISKHLTFAIISDICQFIFQALDSAKHIKTSVALSLIRKPFLEDLLIIEQLFINEQDFLRRFEGDPEKFDPGRISDQNKKDIINECIKRIKPNFILAPDLIYDLRFNKKDVQSFYATCNLATHLVTTRHPAFKTERSNLNFIFSGDEEWESQLDYFYYCIPYMLLYTTEIIDQYLLTKKIIDLKTFKRRKFLRLISQMLQMDQYDQKAIKGESIVNKVVKKLKIICNNCKKNNILYKSDLFTLVHHDYILCRHCLTDLFYESNSMNKLVNNLMK